jgi:formylglycine-generating enzyme required for sulfatase activity
VGALKPNGFGLYDMAGNAVEWCLDALEFQEISLRDRAERRLGDGLRASSGLFRKIRGMGGWGHAGSFVH